MVGPSYFPFGFNRLGVRVPVMMISPWVAKGSVLHRPNGPYPTSEFEHSSIPATLDALFGLDGQGQALTKRTQWAGRFDDIFETEMRTDTIQVLPEVVLPLA